MSPSPYWTLMLQILVFFGIVYLTGLAVLRAALGRNRLDFETHVLATGVGLAAFTVLVIPLNMLGVPLTWWTFLGLAFFSFILPTLRDILVRVSEGEAKEKPPFWTRDDLGLAAALLLTALLLIVYLHGTFASDWLTDDDSWYHAASARYVSENQTYSIDRETRQTVMDAGIHSYIEPYPPSYAVMMGILHQVNQPRTSMMWTLKFFNTLIVSLGILYFYLMAKSFTGNPGLAVCMTGALWVIPCFMSHFIWAQSLAAVLFFPAFHALERSRREPRWTILAALAIAAVLLAQPSTGIIFAVMAGIYWFVSALWLALGRDSQEGSGRGLIRQGLAGMSGIVIAGVYYLPTLIKFGWPLFYYGITRQRVQRASLKVAGVGARDFYGIGDFFFSPAHNNKINQPVGIGPVLFCVAAAGIVLMLIRWRRLLKDRIQVITLTWLVFGTLGVMANYLPISLFPHRFWVFLAIPVAMVAGEFLWFLACRLSLLDVLLSQGTAAAATVALVAVGVAAALYLPPAAETGATPTTWQLIRANMDALTTWQIVLTITSALAAFAACFALIYAMIIRKSGALRIVCAASLILLSTGILFSSGYPKLHHEGIAAWTDGIWLYKARVQGRDQSGNPGVFTLMNDLKGYMRIRNGVPAENIPAFPPNTPMLPLSLNVNHVIGFDMACPPLDPELIRFHRWLQDLATENINEDTVNAIHAEAVKGPRRYRFVVVDHYNCAVYSRRVVDNQRQIMNLSGRIPPERLNQIQEGIVRPEPGSDEEKTWSAITNAFTRIQEWYDREMRERERLMRIMKLMADSGRFRPVPPFYPLGANVFEVVPVSEKRDRLLPLPSN